MQHILIKIEFNDLMGQSKLDYDLYNEKGEIVHKKGQKINSGFLLMLKYVNLYKKDTSISDNNQGNQDNSEIVEFTRELLILGIKKHASIIYIEPSENAVQIKFMVNGTKQEGINLDKSFLLPLTQRLKHLASLDIENTQEFQKGIISISLFNRSVELKISCLPVKYGEKITLQILDEEKSRILEISELFLPKFICQDIEKLIQNPKGLFIVAGPSLSGKTSTLYSMLKQLKHYEYNISTIEDPIKYKFPGINQIKKNPSSKKSFDSVLAGILEQNPDILMIKDIFDKDSLEILCNSALNCELIMLSMHAKDSAQLLFNLINMNVNAELFKSAISGILSQRLIRRICEHCKEKYNLSPQKTEKLFSHNKNTPITLYKGFGCNHCNNTGYSGNIPIFEMLHINDEIKKLMLKKASLDEIKNYFKKSGFRDMKYDGIKKVLRGLTTIEEIERIFPEEE